MVGTCVQDQDCEILIKAVQARQDSSSTSSPPGALIGGLRLRNAPNVKWLKYFFLRKVTSLKN